MPQPPQPTPQQVCGSRCTGCPQEFVGERYIPEDGTAASGMLFVGDSPWKDEVSQGRNFAGAAGSVYETWLTWLGLTRELVTTANVMWCKPPHLGWTDAKRLSPAAYAAAQNCRPYLDDVVARNKPRVIVPMGNVALTRVTGAVGIEKNQGYVHDSLWGIPAVPVFHPSYVMQGKQKLQPMIVNALRRAKRIADGQFQPSQYTLIEDPSPDELRAYIAKFPADLGDVDADIETPYSAAEDEDKIDLDADTDIDAELDADADDNSLMGAAQRDYSYNIIRGGFSLEANVGVSFPFEAPYIDIYMDVLARAQRVWEWSNKHFDSDRLTAAGAKVKVWASSMMAWHFLQSDLPKALAFAAPIAYAGPPWKHESSARPAWYNAMDNVIQRAVREYCAAQLLAQGRYYWFDRHCVQTDPILVRMVAPGITIDRAAQTEFKGVLEVDHAAAIATLQTEVPDAVKPVKRWRSQPADMTGVREIALARDVKVRVPCECRAPIPPATKPRKTDKSCGICGGKGRVVARTESQTLPAWERTENFNPASSPQVIALIKSKGLKVPWDYKTDKPTTSAKHLKKFITRAPVFRTLLDAREKGKLLTTYIWDLDANGLIYTHFGFDPSTWRKNSYAVNLQNIPKRSELAQKFREMIVARPGHMLIEYDSSAIEAVLVGYFAGSQRYIRLAKIGVHDWVTACKVGRPIPIDLPDDEMRARCKAIKKEFPDVREMCKRVVHLSAYMGTPERMYEEYPEYFPSVNDARDLQQLFFDTEPGQDVRAWHKKTLEIASKEKLLKTPFGYWHYFFNVYAYDKKYGKWRLGDDAKRCIAFRPQATASAIQTEILLWIRDHHPEVMPHLRLIIHDSVVAEPPDAEAEHVAAVLAEAFQQPWAQLDGLSIGAEGAWGRNLGKASPMNPNGLRDI